MFRCMTDFGFIDGVCAIDNLILLSAAGNNFSDATLTKQIENVQLFTGIVQITCNL